MSGEDVSLVIVAYHDSVALARALESADLGTRLVANVEASADVAAITNRLRAECINLRANKGFAWAANILARAATTEWLFLANDDVSYLPGLAEAADRAARQGWDVVLPRHLDGSSGQPVPSLRSIPTPARLLVEWVLLPDRVPHRRSFRGIEKWRLPERAEAATAGTASALLVRRAVLLEHPMPEEYFLYWEELDWFWSLRDAGVRVGHDPRLVVVRPGGRNELGLDKWRLMGRNLVLLGRRRYGLFGAGFYALLTALWLARLATTDFLARERYARWAARRAAFSGAWEELQRR